MEGLVVPPRSPRCDWEGTYSRSALRSRHRPAPERWVGGGSSRAGVQISLLAFTPPPSLPPPTPTPTQTSHYGRQITTHQPRLDLG